MSGTDPAAKDMTENRIRAAFVPRAKRNDFVPREMIKSLQLNVMRRVGFCKGGGSGWGNSLEGGNASPKR